jgi:hypothetical protein
MYKVVVARYNESIQWLDPIKDACVIVNKGESLNIPNEICIPNVGRESDSYLWYIINNYDNLPDVVVFTQANISDHRGCGNDHTYMLSMRDEALKYGKSSYTTTWTPTNNQTDALAPNWNGIYSGFLPLNCYKNGTFILFNDWFEKHVGVSYPIPFHLYINALFAVKKELILRHPLQYYIDLKASGDHSINTIESHFFERSWYYIFQ